VSRPSTTVAYPSATQRGERRVIGASGSTDFSSRRSSGLRDGRMRCARCAYSCTASRSIHDPYAPICSSGPGGSAKKIMRGVSTSGHALPFASAIGFAISTSTRCGGA
jgi:hypothetical protein